jgi:predicted DNA-binding protein
MENKKLVIPSKKYRGDSMVVSTRLPNELVSSLDEIAQKTGRTRNEIMQMCLEFAVENLEIKESN